MPGLEALSWKNALVAALALAGVGLIAAAGPSPKPAQNAWEVLEPGLELGVFPAPRPASAGDSRVRALRIDPARFRLKLLNASAPGQGKPLTARDWCLRNDLVAAINASMYQKDLRTSVSLMRTRGHVNNSHLSKDKAVLAFDPKSDGAPPVKLIDRGCEDFAAWKDRYTTLVQNIRMISCDRKNVWSRQPVQWSIAAIGLDRQGRVLFLHSRSPYSPHDLINILLDLPLDLAGAMYVEGGPEAQLFVRSGKRETELVGSYETGFFESDTNDHAWPVPNVIGVVRK